VVGPEVGPDVGPDVGLEVVGPRVGPLEIIRHGKVLYILAYLTDGLRAIAGCSQTQFLFESGGAHHSRRSEIVVHNTCAQERLWFVEDDLGVA
jgi:hypothetical protein